MKQTPKRHSNPISIGLTLFFGMTAMVLMLIRPAVEGGPPGSVLVAGLAPLLIGLSIVGLSIVGLSIVGLSIVGLVVAVRRGVIWPIAPGVHARSCGRRP